jgi:hypothetical protein
MTKETVNSKDSLQSIHLMIDQMQAEFGYLEITIEPRKKTRTNTQNRALHLYLGQLAKALNDAGYDMKRTIRQDVDIPWNTDTAKQYLWGPIQKVVTGLDKTSKADTSQYSDIYETLNRHMAQKFGVSIPWPSEAGKNGA